MLSITLIILAGLLLGTLSGKYPILKKLCRVSAPAQKIGAAALLLFVGISLGANPAFWQSLQTAGPAGTALAIGGIVGSIVMVWLVSKLFFGGED